MLDKKRSLLIFLIILLIFLPFFISAENHSMKKEIKVSDLTLKEEQLDGEIYHYRLSYSCPEGHIVLAADV